MHPLYVLVYMRDNQEKSFEYEASVTPPRGLLSRIIKRLGLEKELTLVKGNLKFFTALLGIFLVLSVFAFIGVKHVLAESSFGPFVSLIFSDPGVVIKYWHSFTFAAFESMPGVTAAALLFSVAFLMLFVRLAAFTFEKLFIVIKLINKQKYGHK
jgi:hypothetical protein